MHDMLVLPLFPRSWEVIPRPNPLVVGVAGRGHDDVLTLPRGAALDYDRIGDSYDQAPHREVTQSFFRAVAPRLRRGDVVLDLGCATGMLSERLAGKGCRVHGIDISRSMLASARRRCRRFGSRVQFVRADLRTLALPVRAAAAFACCDVVNHFTSRRDLLRMFRRVRRHLAPGGVLVFDALNRWCFETYWSDRTYFLAGKAGDLVMECDWDPATELGTATMIAYERGRDGRFRRRTSILRERLHDGATLRSLLRQAGFSRVQLASWSPWPDQHLEARNDRLLCEAQR